MKSNSIRLRLTQTEVATVAAGTRVTEATAFPNGRVFSYTVGTTESDSIVASFDGAELLVLIPSVQAKQWHTSEEVAIETALPSPAGRDVSILIEKDFACLHKRSEETDVYPNPHA